jgi:hypothetical protein
MPDPRTQAVSRLSVAVEKLRKATPDAGESAIEFTPRRIAAGVGDDGSRLYQLLTLPPMRVKPTAESALPARIRKIGVSGFDALLSFAEEGEAFEYTDGQVWEQALSAAAALGLDGYEARKLSEYTCLGLLARRGCPKVRIQELP